MLLLLKGFIGSSTEEEFCDGACVLIVAKFGRQKVLTHKECAVSVVSEGWCRCVECASHLSLFLPVVSDSFVCMVIISLHFLIDLREEFIR